MGDPKRIRKKYATPRHPWVGARIAEEKKLVREYGLRNKKEVWRMDTTLKQFKDRAKKLLARTDQQAQVEQHQLIERMTRLGLIKQGASFDDILGLPIEAVMNRRLQTLLVKKHLARTPKQARQMIIHRHITINGRVVTSPSKLVTLEEEAAIGFAPRSSFANENHPERFSEEELLRKKQKEAAKARKESGDEDEVLAFDEKAIEQAEVLAGEKKMDSVKEEATGEKQPASKEQQEAATSGPREATTGEAATQEKAPAVTKSEDAPATQQEAPEEEKVTQEKEAEKKPQEQEEAAEQKSEGEPEQAGEEKRAEPKEGEE